MINIEQLSIEGFKSIEQMEVEPGRINIITGRNNTGKTSFIESIHMLFNTENFSRFEDNIDNVINVHSEGSELSCKYSESGQSSISQFNDDGPIMVNSRDVGIIRPERSVAIEFFIDGVMDIVETGPNSDYFIDRFFGREFDLEEYQISPGSINAAVKEGVADLPEERLYSGIDGNAVIVRVGNNKYPFVYFGDFYRDISQEIVQNSIQEFLKEHPKIDGSKDSELSENMLKRIFDDLLVPRFGNARFIYEAPPTKSGVKFIDSVMVSGSDVGSDDAAVRMSNIEDYLQKHNIVANLEDFSFDDLVFSNESGKYQVPYDFMGDGFKAIVGILWELSDQRSSGNVLLLEEPENHMHPGYLNKMVHQLVQLSMENQIQLFITTHNIDFLRSFFSQSIVGSKEEYLKEEFRVFQMESETMQVVSYDEAEKRMNELQLDLRGL